MQLRLVGHVVALFILGVFSSVSFAAEKAVFDLDVLEDLTVYAAPNRNSKILTNLSLGDTAVIAPKAVAGYRKVWVEVKGKQVPGYIIAKKIVHSEIRQRGSESVEVERDGYNSGYAVGVALVPSYMKQGKSSFQLSDSTTYETSEFTSTSFFLSIFFDKPLSEKLGLRGNVNMRTTAFKGTAIQSDNTALPAKTVRREQTLIGLSVTLKRYTSVGSKWWWGGGAELAMGNDLTVKINNQSAPTSAQDKPFFAMAFGALGGDYKIPRLNTFYLVPDLRVGVIATTTPITTYIESFIGVAYLF